MAQWKESWTCEIFYCTAPEGLAPPPAIQGGKSNGDSNSHLLSSSHSSSSSSSSPPFPFPSFSPPSSSSSSSFFDFSFFLLLLPLLFLKKKKQSMDNIIFTYFLKKRNYLRTSECAGSEHAHVGLVSSALRQQLKLTQLKFFLATTNCCSFGCPSFKLCVPSLY